MKVMHVQDRELNFQSECGIRFKNFAGLEGCIGAGTLVKFNLSLRPRNYRNKILDQSDDRKYRSGKMNQSEQLVLRVTL